MFKYLTHILVLGMFTLGLAVLTLPAAPPEGKGGGKGGGGGEDGGGTAPFTVTALHLQSGIYAPKGLSDPNPDNGSVYIVGDEFLNGAMLSEVDTLGNVLKTTPLSFNANSVTSDGLVVGVEHRDWPAGAGGDGNVYRDVAVVWKDGDIVELPLVVGVENAAYDVNASWQIVGREASYDSVTGEQFLTGVYWELGTDGSVVRSISLGNFLPRAISKAGYIVGWTADTIVPAIAQVDADGVVTVMSLGLPPGATEGYAFDVNDFPEVTGHYYDENGAHAFRWSLVTGYENLGKLHKKSTYAIGRGIDADGMVVGKSIAARNGGTSYSDMRAFVWDGTEMFDLNDLIPAKSGVDWLYEAFRINSSGQILCFGWNGTDWQAYLLSPAP